MIAEVFFRKVWQVAARAGGLRLGLGLFFFPTLALADGFWAVWGDGKAEVSGYRLTIPRYGQERSGSLLLIYVTEDYSDSLRVKADPGRHPQSDVYPVLKLNAIRKFQTGIYDYSVMTSVFSRVDFGPTERVFPLRKLSLSSQEWCGHVYHQVLPQGPAGSTQQDPQQNKNRQAEAPGWLSTSHSYFDGEADEQRVLRLPQPPAGDQAPPGNNTQAPIIAEDELPIVLRTYAGRREFLAPGERRAVTFLPSLVRARLLHKPLAFTEASIYRLPEQLPIKTPAGEFMVISYVLSIRDGDGATFHFSASPPHVLVHYHWTSGEQASLLGTTRLPYWQLHDKTDEALLKKLGLSPIPLPLPGATP